MKKDWISHYLLQMKSLLGFYKNDGKFDQNAVYISKEKEAILWGRDIFEEYETMAPEYIYLKE